MSDQGAGSNQPAATNTNHEAAAISAAAAAAAPSPSPSHPLKRSLDDMSSDHDASDASLSAARDALMRERRALEQSFQSGGGGGATAAATAQPVWSAAAVEFALQRLHDADAVAHFRRLVAHIREATPHATTAAAATPAAAALANGDERKETESGSAAPILPTISAASAPSVVSVAAPPLPAMSPAAATPITPATPATPAAAASSPSSSSSSGSLLATISDVSLLVPRGKYQLQLSSTGATFAVPATPAKSLSFAWSDVDTVFDVADVNKRDWLLVLLLKKGRGVAVGKQTHHAFVVKMLATDKLKETRASVAAPVAASELADAQTRMQSYLNEHAHTGATKLSSGMVSLLRLVPALRSVPFVSHEPGIFSSLKQLPCVSCKLGVEDGALYFLRTGLLFIKPVLYIPLADLDGITPARGMSSTFDMKVGIVGQKNDTAFIMIEPKEEQAISKYCAFLATEQARMEKKEKMDKAAAAAAAAAPAAAAAASSNSAAVASSGSYATNASPISLLDDEDVAEQTIPSSSAAAAGAAAAAGGGGAALPVLDAVSSANVIAGPRPSRKAKPASFVGMEDEDEEEAAQPATSSASAAASGADSKQGGGGGSDGDSSSSDDSEEEWSDASDSDSDESAEYDSAKDDEEINSEDERERERERMRRKAKEEDDQSDEEEEEEAEAEGADAHETPDETMAD